MTETLVRSHLRWGWASLLLFAAGGLGLEALHALKLPVYLDAGMEARRLVWTLAHAHGTLLGLVHVAFAWSVGQVPVPRVGLASRALKLATVLLPGGFALGGIGLQGGDPGPGVWLAPIGALALLVSLALVATGARPRDG